MLTAIPYLGLLVLGLPYYIVWAFFLGQVQATCNRLALAAAPEAIRSAMRQLEQWTRLRWIGWMLLGPSFVVITSSTGTLIRATGSTRGESMLGMAVFAIVGAAGAVLLYLGSKDTRDLYQDLSGGAQLTVAGYLRIDKNAAWTMFWIAGGFGLMSLMVGTAALASNTPSTPTTDGTDAWSAIGQAAGLLLLAGYAVYKALQLRGQIGWLESAAASAGYGSGTSLR